MFKWCKISKRSDPRIVWEGRVIGIGKPIFDVRIEMEEDNKLPKPSFKRKVVPAKRRKDGS